MRGHIYYIFAANDQQWAEEWGAEYIRLPSSLPFFETMARNTAQYEQQALAIHPGLGPLLQRLRQLFEGSALSCSQEGPSYQDFRRIFVDPIVAPISLGEGWQWASRCDFPPVWEHQEMYLQALHLIKSSSDEWMDPLVDSALCLKLEDLPTDVRLAIYKTGLFRKQDHLLPIISVVATWDPRVRLPHQFPVNAVLSMGLPALRLLRTLQNRVNPNAKAPLRTATLLFTLEHMVCFLHTLEPGTDEPARTTIIEQAGGGMDLSNLRFVQHLKVKLHTCFIQALDLSPYSINDRLGIKIDEWTTTEGLHERFAHSVRLGQAQAKIETDTDTDTDTESDRSGWSHRSASTPATSNIGQESIANV